MDMLSIYNNTLVNTGKVGGTVSSGAEDIISIFITRWYYLTNANFTGLIWKKRH